MEMALLALKRGDPDGLLDMMGRFGEAVVAQHKSGLAGT
jgi:hypothetical protein